MVMVSLVISTCCQNHPQLMPNPPGVVDEVEIAIFHDEFSPDGIPKQCHRSNCEEHEVGLQHHWNMLAPALTPHA